MTARNTRITKRNLCKMPGLFIKVSPDRSSEPARIEYEIRGGQPLHVLGGMLTRIGLTVNRGKKARAVCDTAACAKPALRGWSQTDGSREWAGMLPDGRGREKMRRQWGELAAVQAMAEGAGMMMSRRRLIQTSAAGVVGATALRLRFAKEVTQMSSKHGYASVNGLNLYYEIHGVGEPLILLHGGLGSIDMFGEVLPLLAKGRQVIAVDLQGHGRTADIDRPIRYELMADDIRALIKFLKLPKADVMGYSLGAGTAIRTAIRHPEKVRKLVVVSSPCRQSGWDPEVVTAVKQVTGSAAETRARSPACHL